MKTIYKINTANDQYFAIDKSAVDDHNVSMVEAGWPEDYKVKITSTPGRMADDEYALAVLVPDELHAALATRNPVTWIAAERFCESLGFRLMNDSNKASSWNYRFEKCP